MALILNNTLVVIITLFVSIVGFSVFSIFYKGEKKFRIFLIWALITVLLTGAGYYLFPN